MYFVLYDIADPIRLKKVAKVIKRYGTRVQKSVFECRVNDRKFSDLYLKLGGIISKKDSVIYYKLSDQICSEKVPKQKKSEKK